MAYLAEPTRIGTLAPRGNEQRRGNTPYHRPVLLRESVDALRVRGGGVYADVTFGGGGHSKEILRRLVEATSDAADGGKGHLYGMDQDADAISNAQGMTEGGRFTFIRGNFRYLRNFLRYEGAEQVDGILADLGVSSHHFDDAQRGFSFRKDAPLDMRMNRQAARTAADIVNTYDEKQLAGVLRNYGEIERANALAKAIVGAREKSPVSTTGQLANIVTDYLGRTGTEEMPRIFQALRIEVNDEMGALRQLLLQAVALLRPGGRLVVITYHSLEDRLVKNVIRTGNCEGDAVKDFYGRVHAPLRNVLGRPVTPSAEEINENPRSRSAKLRAGEKTM